MNNARSRDGKTEKKRRRMREAEMAGRKIREED
jgi:hypothetical protein